MSKPLSETLPTWRSNASRKPQRRAAAIEAITDYGRAIASGESAQAIILITQRYFLKLHRVRGELDGGRSLDDALRGLRPPLHFKQKDAFAGQVRNWSRAVARRGSDRAFPRPPKPRGSPRSWKIPSAERLVLALSAMAAPRQRNRAPVRPGAAERELAAANPAPYSARKTAGDIT